MFVLSGRMVVKCSQSSRRINMSVTKSLFGEVELPQGFDVSMRSYARDIEIWVDLGFNIISRKESHWYKLAWSSWFGWLNCSGRGSSREVGAQRSPGRQESKTANVAKRQAKWSLEPNPIDR